jgi:predicted transcriptional regulator
MKNILTSVILSIKPIYSKAIIDGTKKVEFRKKKLKRNVGKVFIYSSSPDKLIIGYFTISNIVEDSPQKLWEKYNKVGGINEIDFFEYYKGFETGFSIIIDEVYRFEKGIDPIDFIEKFCAPQSYIYVEEERLIKAGNIVS